MAPLPAAPQPTVAAIFAAHAARQDKGYREHLGASIIGNSCNRALWYAFRWATPSRHAGRMMRLFETGHLAEARFVADLRAVGVEVLEVDPETGRQWSCRDDTGHFGGSMDGAGLGLPEAPKTWHALEFKTHNEKNFFKLKQEGVRKAKPLHYAQMQVYMHLFGLTRALYLAANKNDDDLYQERVEHDPVEALRLIAKAQGIIAAKQPPQRISRDPAWWECRFCDHSARCHGAELPEPHCRSCLHSTPTDGGAWHCDRHTAFLTRAEQEQGCQQHLFIPGLVHGEQVDAGDDWVEYRLSDGTTWRDGAPS